MSRRRSAKEPSDGGSLFRFVLGVAILAWLVRSLIFTPFSIPSGSMLPTLYIGDYLVVSKWPYGYSRYSFPFHFPGFGGRILSQLPKRGDVVVFVPPGRESEDYVKRVIALPGDTIAIHDGRIILNGQLVRDDSKRPVAIPISPNSPCRVVPPARPVVEVSGQSQACVYSSYRETLPNGATFTIFDQVNGGMADDMPEVRVPVGHLFLMGDNRDDSLDSRFSLAEGGIGFVPMEDVVGRASVIFWSTDGNSSIAKPWTWFTALRAGRIGRSLAGGGR